MSDDGPDAGDSNSLDETAVALALSQTPTYKVLGNLSSTNAVGVLGKNTATSGVAHGVEGVTESAGGDRYDTPIGVRGIATSNESGPTYGVKGSTDSVGGRFPYAAGVYGEATATSGDGAKRTYGVKGVTQSDGNFSSGVRGRAEADSGETYGVKGQTFSESDGAAGVAGSNAASSGANYGVYGEVDSGNDASAGVYGDAGSGGASDGVVGSSTADDDSFGVRSDGNMKVSGSVDVSKTGVSVYRSSRQIVSSGTTTKVQFDSTENDDFGGYSTQNYDYTVQNPDGGDYHVSATVEWFRMFDGGVDHNIYIYLNDSVVARRVQQVGGSSATESYVHDHISKTLFGLSKGDTIDIRAKHTTGENEDIHYGKADTYLTIHKVG